MEGPLLCENGHACHAKVPACASVSFFRNCCSMRNDLPEDWMLNASCAEIEYQIGKYFRRFVDQCVEIETNDHPHDRHN
jgi:hypothetical protein